MKATLLDATGARTWALIFDKGDEPVAGLTAFAKAQKVGAAHFTAIGAFSDVTLGYFDRAKRDFFQDPVAAELYGQFAQMIANRYRGAEQGLSELGHYRCPPVQFPNEFDVNRPAIPVPPEQ